MKRQITAILAIASLSGTPVWAICSLQSGATTAALVELYTSEGCSSCPPADKRLSAIRASTNGTATAVPLSLHVDYWDYIGWKEPFAQRQFSARHSWLVHANAHRTVFTPHFFVSGKEILDWRAGLDNELKRVTAVPARATIRIRAEATGPGAISVSASAAATADHSRLAMFIAITEDNLTSRISAGENRGMTLSHDHVVREWVGPLPLNGGRVDFENKVSMRSNWDAARLGVAAFVQDLATGQVLQAVGASQCVRS